MPLPKFDDFDLTCIFIVFRISATKFMLFRELDGEIKTFGPALIITHHQIGKAYVCFLNQSI